MPTGTRAGHGPVLNELDRILARHPFGDSDYINEQLHISYQRRLAILGGHFPSAARLLDALRLADGACRYRLIGDTVVRAAIQHAQAQVETGKPYGLPLAQCNEIFEAATRLIEQGGSAPLGSGLTVCVGPEPRHGWVWNEARPDNIFSRSFDVILARDHPDARPCTPASAELEMLARGVELLDQLLPQMSGNALSHTHTVVVFPETGAWKTRRSSSEFRLSGTIFLGRRVLANPWAVAEHVFHESLHQQLYDFRAGHSLLSPDFARPGAPRIHSLWNRPTNRENQWDIHRAIAAFHVYVHLSLLAELADQRGEDLRRFGPVKLTGSRTCLARAHYLSERIRVECWEELGAAGKRLVDWFDTILEALDPSPPAAGAHVHLLLDRYWREAAEMACLPEQSPDQAALPDLLSGLIEEEVAATRHVIAMMGRDVRPFEEALGLLSDKDVVTRFLSVRTLIARTILAMCPETYILSASMRPDEVVKAMVEESSERLDDLLAA